ncbi:MAG: ABC transporter permease [Clostridia bacterium]|nr:ABC transporter permease [Clostridia bacterium]
MTIVKLPLRNLVRHPGRTAALTVLVALLSMSLLGGSIIVLSLNSGLSSLENRLGADIIVLPASAKSKVNLDNLYLQGTTGYYYMSAEKQAQIAAREGIAEISGQVFLATLRADCCSLPIQVIGFDPETDFTVQPWIAERLKQGLGPGEVVVGSKVAAGVGESVRIYSVSCPVVARLGATGTGLDTAVYCTTDTMATLLDAARAMNHELKISGDPASVVSAVYIRVDPSYSVEQVANDINVHVRKVEAVRTRSVISDVSSSLNGVASTVKALILAVWTLSFILLASAFLLLGGERKRQYAVLRVLGMSRPRLSALALREALLVSAFGGVIGIALALLLVLSFHSLIEKALALPFLMPTGTAIALLAAGTLLCVCVSGSLAAAFSAHRLSRTDTGIILREGA